MQIQNLLAETLLCSNIVDVAWTMSSYVKEALLISFPDRISISHDERGRLHDDVTYCVVSSACVCLWEQ